MSVLASQHLAAVIFFAALLAFERIRRSRALSLIRHPLSAYVARGALVALYLGFIGVDPRAWFSGVAPEWIAVSGLCALGTAVWRRRDVASLSRSDPTMVVQAGYLAVAVALVEELIFRGAFVLVAAVTPATIVLASLGSSVAYVVWRSFVYRDRDPRSLAVVFAGSITLGVLAGGARSLWPPLIAHASYVMLAGPPRAPFHSRATRAA